MEPPVQFPREFNRDHVRHGPDIKGILLFTFLLLLLWFLITRVILWVQPYRLRTAEAVAGAIAEQWRGNGLAVRQEVVVHAPASGRLTLMVPEGQRVRAGDVVCEVRATPESGSLPTSLERIDQEMRKAEEDVRQAKLDGARRRSEVAAQIAAAEEKVRRLQAAGEMEQAQQAEAELRSWEGRLREIGALEAQAVQSADLRRQELLRHREALLGGSRTDVFLIRAVTPGHVSYRLDGLEGLLTTQTPVHDVAEVRHEGTAVQQQDGGLVHAGAPLFRLVDSYQFYLYVSVQGKSPLPAGETVRVSMSGTEVEMRVQQVEERIDKTLALLVTNAFPEQFLYQRHSQVTIYRGRREGVMIPRTAVVNETGKQAGVYVLVERKPVLTSVTVRAMDDTSAIVDGIPLGARVVTNPRLLQRRQ